VVYVNDAVSSSDCTTRMVWWLINDEWIWKYMEGSSVALFKVPSWNMSEELRKTTKHLRTADLRAEIWTEDHPNTKQEC
jgi:hypothetical protein